MAKLHGNTRISQVVCGEIRVKLIGPPMTMAKMAYMDDQGTTYGQTIWQPWSKRSLDYLGMLKESLEDDFAQTILLKEGTEPGDTEGDIEEGNAFHDVDEDDMDFRS